MVAIQDNPQNLEEKIGREIIRAGEALLKDDLSSEEEHNYIEILGLVVGLAEEKGIDTDVYLEKINVALEKKLRLYFLPYILN